MTPCAGARYPMRRRRPMKVSPGALDAIPKILLCSLGLLSPQAAAPAAEATPPPPTAVVTDCRTPVYAVDSLVCEDPELLGLDRLLGTTAARVGAGEGGDVSELTPAQWFRHSRQCAFDSDQRACLVAAYCARLALLEPATLEQAPACGGPPGEVVSAAQYTRHGLVRDTAEARVLNGREVRLQGFVDHGNLYGNASAEKLLQERWSGPGPEPQLWRFDLKAVADDPVGESFAVWVPNGLLRDDMLRKFLADARSYRPTEVWVQGRLVTFDAPTNALSLIGLRLELRSASEIRFRPPPKN